MNTLYYGDNLNILRRYIKDESVDLIYLDPPFNSNRIYNVLFTDESGTEADSQIMAFKDTWHWTGAAHVYHELILEGDAVSSLLEAFYSFIGTNQTMAYLVMMAVRLKELRRVLKSTGSIYLHCDPTASHYLKLLLDAIFTGSGGEFKNELIWCYTSPSKVASYFPRKHDIIFFYTKGKTNKMNFDDVRIPYSKESLSRANRNVIKKGGTIYDHVELNAKGKIPEDWWADIVPASRKPGERLGYPTQKPLALLERIIKASSDKGDVILDPFAGCGTTIAAAQKLNRQWIGIDITQLSIALLKNRLEGNLGQLPKRDYEVIGEPEDLRDAQKLATEDRYQFQYWALSQVQARPLGGEMDGRSGKKGSDKGIDGIKVFIDDNSGNAKKVIVQVKSGHVNSGLIRDLVGTVDREGAAIGVFLTLEKATSHMLNEAASAGFYTSEFFGRFPRIQILTLEEILAGKQIQMPSSNVQAFKQAEKLKLDSDQDSLFED